MAKAIIHSQFVSTDYQDRRSRGYVSIAIKAQELKQQDDEWRVALFTDQPNGAALRRALHRDVIKLIKTLYLDSKVTFSQKAGCSCGCSPGFYVKDASGESVIPNGTTVFVEIVD